MTETGKKSIKSGLEALGINKVAECFWNLTPAELTEHALTAKEGVSFAVRFFHLTPKNASIYLAENFYKANNS